MREFAVLFDNGVWRAMEKYGDSAAVELAACPSFETAIMEIAMRTDGKVLIKVITET